MKFLKQADEKQEQLHPRQAFTQTRTLSWTNGKNESVWTEKYLFCSIIILFLVDLIKVVNHTQSHQVNMWNLPAEKGKNASLLTNLPSASRKCSGLKVSGASHSFLSNSTDVRLGITEVPCTQRQTEVLLIFVYYGIRRAAGIEEASSCDTCIYLELDTIMNYLKVICLVS